MLFHPGSICFELYLVQPHFSFVQAPPPRLKQEQRSNFLSVCLFFPPDSLRDRNGGMTSGLDRSAHDPVYRGEPRPVLEPGMLVLELVVTEPAGEAAEVVLVAPGLGKEETELIVIMLGDDVLDGDSVGHRSTRAQTRGGNPQPKAQGPPKWQQHSRSYPSRPDQSLGRYLMPLLCSAIRAITAPAPVPPSTASCPA